MATRKSKTGQSSTKALTETPEVDPTPELGGTGELEDTPELGGTPRRTSVPMLIAAAQARARSATGDDILALGRNHLGETYLLGARAPMANANWKGPWDCAEFASWCVFQASGVLYGTEPRDDPMMADAFTGFWAQQAKAGNNLISVRDAAGIAGAAVLRRPTSGLIGHIVISDGQGGTVEAHSSLRGVIAGTLSGRRWDVGVLVPGIRYLATDTPAKLPPAPRVIRMTNPLTRGDKVLELQRRLVALGMPVGTVDGIYGPQTLHAVRAFQAKNGLLADGEVGPSTQAALSIA